MSEDENERKGLYKRLEKLERELSYNRFFPKSRFLARHEIEYPRSYYIQFVGARGVGKSSLINRLSKRNFKVPKPKTAKMGVVETTERTEFFDITSSFIFEGKLKKNFVDRVILCDQPGLGGADINRNRR